MAKTIYAACTCEQKKIHFFFLPYICKCLLRCSSPHLTYPSTARVVGAPQMFSQPVSSIFLCFPFPPETLRTLGLFILWCCLPTCSSVCVVFFPLSLCLARRFWPGLINRRHVWVFSLCIWNLSITIIVYIVSTFLTFCVVAAFSLHARILRDGLANHPSPVLFLQVEISSPAPIPLFRPGSVHSGSANWDRSGRAFLDELRVVSFPWFEKFPH